MLYLLLYVHRGLGIYVAGFLFQAKTEEQLASDKAWMVAERVWLVHRGGFAAARVLHAGMPGAEGVDNLPEGKCRVKLDHGGELLDVDEEDIEKVNFALCSSYVNLYWPRDKMINFSLKIVFD